MTHSLCIRRICNWRRHVYVVSVRRWSPFVVLFGKDLAEIGIQARCRGNFAVRVYRASLAKQVARSDRSDHHGPFNLRYLGLDHDRSIYPMFEAIAKGLWLRASLKFPPSSLNNFSHFESPLLYSIIYPIVLILQYNKSNKLLFLQLQHFPSNLFQLPFHFHFHIS